MVNKGATKEIHVQAGRKVKGAEIELSEYYMPGLGGKALSEENALETADAQLDYVFAYFAQLAEQQELAA